MRTSFGHLALCGTLLAAGAAAAHGINGHVHVTGWAIESLPPGELRDFFADPVIKDAALIGASFPDSGYAIDDGYGEIAHWEPFTEAHIAYVRARFGPDFAGDEARRHLAFLMGAACHGFQDEVFDSVFLHHIAEHDGQGQDAADPGTDAFLFVDGHLRFKPPVWVPFDDLVRLFADAAGHEVSAATIRDGMQRVKFLVIDHFDGIAPGLNERYRPVLPWTAAHYMDPEVPGSLAAEVPATAAYLQALWDRLHDRFPAQALAGHTWPAPERRLRSVDPASVDSWITVIFGAGAVVGSLNADTVTLLDAEGAPVPIAVTHTRWSGSRPDENTRLVQLRPRAPLAPNAEYTVRLAPEVRLLDGRLLGEPWTFTFRTACLEGGECGAPDGGNTRFPAPDGGAPEPDAAPAEPDAAPPAPDAGPPDAMPPAPDAAPAEPDAAPPDASRPADAAPAPDAAPPAPRAGGGDGCSVGAPGRGAPWLLLPGLLLLIRRRGGG